MTNVTVEQCKRNGILALNGGSVELTGCTLRSNFANYLEGVTPYSIALAPTLTLD